MVIQGVQKKLFKRIKYNGKIYRRTDTPVIGGIAESLKDDAISTKGTFYLIDDYIWGDGEADSTSIIADDGEPCGLHKHFANKDYYYYR